MFDQFSKKNHHTKFLETGISLPIIRAMGHYCGKVKFNIFNTLPASKVYGIGEHVCNDDEVGGNYDPIT